MQSGDRLVVLYDLRFLLLAGVAYSLLWDVLRAIVRVAQPASAFVFALVQGAVPFVLQVMGIARRECIPCGRHHLLARNRKLRHLFIAVLRLVEN